MAVVSVTNTFVAGGTIVAGDHNTNFTDLVNYINNRNDTTNTWDGCSISTADRVPLTVNNSTGANAIANFQDNGTTVASILDGGLLTYYHIGCRVYNSANIAIANNTQTVVAYDTERYDTDALHSTATNTGRLTATRAGRYLIFTHILWAANATGQRGVRVRLNGTTDLGGVLNDAAGAGTTRQTAMTIHNLSATDYVETLVFQDSGGNLNVTASANESPEFGMAYMGTSA